MTLETHGIIDDSSDRTLSVARFGDGWAVKHGDGYLGRTRTRDEARGLVQALLASEAALGYGGGDLV